MIKHVFFSMILKTARDKFAGKKADLTTYINETLYCISCV